VRQASLVNVLLTGCSAVLTGARSFAAIGQWARGAPWDALARLGALAATFVDAWIAPSAATARRVLNTACPGGPSDPLDRSGRGRSPRGGRKERRGSHHGEISAAHLPVGSTGADLTVTPLRVQDETNEFTCFDELD
jgi:hypothetical protein